MRLSTVLAALVWPIVSALHEEEAGLYDFVVATAGHGATKYVHASGTSAIVTSDSPMNAGAVLSSDSPSETSCTVACRDMTTGALLWRRNVCSIHSDRNHHITTAKDDYVYTMDHAGVLRAWTMDLGELAWDAPTDKEIDQPRLWAVGAVVASTANHEQLTIRNAESGNTLATLSAKDALKQAKVTGSGQAMWLRLLDDNDKMQAIVGWVALDKKNGLTSSGGSLALVEISVSDEGASLGSTSPFKNADGTILVSSLEVQRVESEFHAMAVLVGQSQVAQFSLSSGFSDRAVFSKLKPSWTSIETIHPTLESGIVGVGATDTESQPSMDIFHFETSTGWNQLYAVPEETRSEAVVYCPSMKLGVSLQRDQGLSVMAWRSGKTVEVGGDSSLAISDHVTSFTLLSCEESEMAALISTTLGTTMQLTFTPTAGGVSSEIAWTAEEGLSQVSSALLLDASHASSIADAHSVDEEHGEFDLSSRLNSQWEALKSIGGSRIGASKAADYAFGFYKVAVLLSKDSHRLWGMDTLGDNRGKLRWTLDLPPTASWHSLVHGTATSRNAVHGANGGVHSRELLVLSSVDDTVQWTCVDGTTGAVHASASVSTPSAVSQVVPLHIVSSHGSSSCRQMALLLHHDNSVSIVPDDDTAKEAALAYVGQSAVSRNGLYSHVLKHDQDASLKSLQITSIGDDASTIVARLVGQTSFPGERIVGVAYPPRDEVVQSPSTVLGDDSLLLKYLNPHMAAIVTMSDASDADDDDDFSSAFTKASDTAAKRKPMGVTPPGDNAQSDTESVEDSPNLFVNIMDTVSGRVLYRASHANAAESDNIPVLINENWIIYTFFNFRTRRTDLGVLSLYEGMIDKKGITAFSAPDQAEAFSSMESRDSKPAVLGKTYGLAKTVTALGVTSTRGGISARHVLVATGDDKIMEVDRRVLEPRRPTGEVKDHEKLEGLRRYSPLIPLVSLWCPSYNQTVHSVQDIVSASTALESQSLILAYGGSDIFFTRLAPSKGFDVLPDSFNRNLLALVVLGLVGLLFVAKSMSSRKTCKIGWS